jgi:hypothetical protein
MADFYPLISRAVSSLPENTAENRAAIYERARAALVAQLRSLEPPLSEDEIADARLALEDTIQRIEDEQNSVFVDDSFLEDDAGLQDDARPVAPDMPPVPEPANYDDDAGGRIQPPRPRIAQPRPQVDRRKLIVGGVLGVVILGIAALAFWANRGERAQVAATPDASQPAAPQEPERKFDERVGGETKPAQPTAPQSGSQQGIAVAQRAILYEETSDNPQAPRSFVGRAVWRLDSASAGQGRPVEQVVRADVELPDAGLSMSFVLRRNTDVSLPASHTIEMTFTVNNDDRKIRDVGLPQFKTEESARGAPLAGVPVPVTENVFLVGLSNADADVTRNLELIRNRPWIDIPIRYANGQRAVIAFEKGVSGERVLQQALDAWGTPAAGQ